MIDRDRVLITTAGEAGAAVGEGSIKTPGGPARLLGVSIDYAGEPVTTVVKLEDRHGLGGVVFTRTATATDGTFRPTLPVHDSTGAEDATAEPVAPTVDGLSISVSSADAEGTVLVEAYFEN